MRRKVGSKEGCKASSVKVQESQLVLVYQEKLQYAPKPLCPERAMDVPMLIFVCLLTHELEFTHSVVARCGRNRNEEMSASYGEVMGTQSFP